MTLYEIREEYRRTLESAVDVNEDGEFVNENGETIGDMLVMMDGAFEDKAEAYALYIKELSVIEDALAAEIKAIQGRKSSITRKIERLKGDLSTAMLELGKPKIETTKAKLSLRRSESVELTVQPEWLPEQYRRVKTTIEADKTAIKEAIKAGKEIEGAALVEKQSLIVK